ncbi:phage scaffolding protein [Cetobacterium sp.]|uniref:phage scaffolding protein n=1 Tax=Cetobacterium sp. TaxID=2071632 RepID=UPI003F30204A
MKNKSNFKFYIQLFGAITVAGINEAIKDCKTPEEITAKLEGLGVVKIQEKEVIKEHTKESVQAFMTQNKEFSDSLYNSNIKNFLAEKLGKKAEEITDEDIQSKLISENNMNIEIKKYNDKLIDGELEKQLGKNYELLKPHIKIDTIKIGEDLKITGIDEQVGVLKTNYPDLFKVDPAGEPGGGTGSSGGTVKAENPWTKENWNEDKQTELFKTNPELANKYMQETGYSY